MRKDSHLVALMQVLCLFAPDRPRLSDRQSVGCRALLKKKKTVNMSKILFWLFQVSNIYDRYILLLKHYLEARHGFTRGRTLLAAVLTNLAELQALTDNYGHILLHVDPSKVDPLVLEVFNLSDREKCSPRSRGAPPKMAQLCDKKVEAAHAEDISEAHTSKHPMNSQSGSHNQNLNLDPLIT